MRKSFTHYLILVLVAVAVIVYITPIYWILATSLKGLADITTKLPKFVFEVSLENYQKLMPSDGGAGRYTPIFSRSIGGFTALRFFFTF